MLTATKREHPQFLTDIVTMRLPYDFLDKMKSEKVKFSQNSRSHLSVSGFETILPETADAPYKTKFFSAILILTNHLCGSGFPAAKNRGKMPLTQYFLIKSTL